MEKVGSIPTRSTKSETEGEMVTEFSKKGGTGMLDLSEKVQQITQRYFNTVAEISALEKKLEQDNAPLEKQQRRRFRLQHLRICVLPRHLTTFIEVS